MASHFVGLAFGLVGTAYGWYFPGVAPHDFTRGECVEPKVNKLTSTRTQVSSTKPSGIALCHEIQVTHTDLCMVLHVRNAREREGRKLCSLGRRKDTNKTVQEGMLDVLFVDGFGSSGGSLNITSAAAVKKLSSALAAGILF